MLGKFTCYRNQFLEKSHCYKALFKKNSRNKLFFTVADQLSFEINQPCPVQYKVNQKLLISLNLKLQCVL